MADLSLMNRFRRRLGDGGDRGSALVAAVGVAIIGVALSIVVMSRAITVSNDAQRDRVRTAEIHSAEGALDAALFELENATACPGPSFSPIIVGEGTSAVEVTVTYTYYDADGNELTSCSDGEIQGSPKNVLVSAVGVPVEPTAAGVAPERRIEAMAELVPAAAQGYQTAIFASSTLSTYNPLVVQSLDGTQVPTVRVEGTGTWSCHAGVAIDGDVIVVEGSATFENANCVVRGNLWVKNNFTGKQPKGTEPNIGGNLTARYGTLTFTNANFKVGGSVKAGGNIGGANWQTLQAQSICAANLTPCPAGSFGPDPQPVGLPEIDYVPSDWTAKGYSIKSKATFFDEWIAQSNANQQWQIDQIKNSNCTIGPWMFYNGAQPVLNLNGGPASKTPSVYDLRDCPFSPQSITFKLYADTAIFTNQVTTNGPTYFQSGDGELHHLFIIIPDGGTANNGKAECTKRGSYEPKSMMLQTGVYIQDKVIGMYYTPCDLTFTNAADTVGQIYGRNVTTSTPNTNLYYVPLEVPGVQLGIPTEVSGNYSVRVMYKHETRD